ncbi:MAG: AmmeMemoRadiSam system radical SAM enzyme [Candidatus Omnitrophica bacterium]|nr:AmmeMemoRadiSam system radical SAM enzyme [Candidatus Omnitrophota bacterium]
MTEALLYERLEDNKVHCFLCAHHCKILPDKWGFCGVRQNINGTLYTQVFGKPIAMHVDPIEKKPMYHFLPGSSSFSLATIGCNFHCGFCQNWEISQARVKDGAGLEGTGIVLPETIVESALKNKCQSISYTYTEPTIFFEYAQAIAKLAKPRGLYNIFVTNGYMSRDCLKMIRPYLDAANVDLKFFKDGSYRRVCSGSLSPVLDSIRLMKEMGVWVEITTLIVPGENDSGPELKDIADFIAGLDKDMPWHISRFHPDFEFGDRQATPEATLKKALDIGKDAGLTYIYVGNVLGLGNDTYCPECKKLLIKREVFEVLEYNIKQGKCVFCNSAIKGVFV